MVMDGDLPPKAYFGNEFSPKLSAIQGGFHTVVSGRMVGVSPNLMHEFAENDVHVHIYTHHENPTHEQMKNAAPSHFHLYPFCTPENWVKEYSRYDAGWLHCFQSANEGDLLRATWDDLNMPARMNTLAAAGLPMIQYDNTGHIVAVQEHLKKIDAGLFYTDAGELRNQLADSQRMDALNRNILQNRFRFCFDEYVPALMDFFAQVIDKTKKR